MFPFNGSVRLSTVDIRAGPFSVGGRPGHWGVLGSIPDPQPLSARSTPSCDKYRCPQTWLVSPGAELPGWGHWVVPRSLTLLSEALHVWVKQQLTPGAAAYCGTWHMPALHLSAHLMSTPNPHCLQKGGLWPQPPSKWQERMLLVAPSGLRLPSAGAVSAGWPAPGGRVSPWLKGLRGVLGALFPPLDITSFPSLWFPWRTENCSLG